MAVEEFGHEIRSDIAKRAEGIVGVVFDVGWLGPGYGDTFASLDSLNRFGCSIGYLTGRRPRLVAADFRQERRAGTSELHDLGQYAVPRIAGRAVDAWHLVEQRQVVRAVPRFVKM